MAWPKGRPRGPRKQLEVGVSSPTVMEAPKAFSKGSRWTMKAGANWEGATSDDEGQDKLHIPPHMIPDGMDLQWVTNTVYGEEMRQHRTSFERRGWTPVHPVDFDSRFDGMFTPKGHAGEISYQGLVLMARPLEMSKKAKEKQRREAREQIAVKEAQFKGGQLEGVTLGADHSTATQYNHIRRTMERLEIPKE